MRAFLLGLVFVVGFVASAAAQDTNLITVARRNIQGVDQISSQSPVTSEMLAFGDEQVLLLADVASADKRDPTKSFWLKIFVSYDNGVTWNVYGGMQFQGAADVDLSAPIGMYVPAAALIGARVRLELDAPVRLSLGGSVTITRTPPF
jgi:hypothetical protein